MPSFNMEFILWLISLLFIAISVFDAIALVIPALGQHVYGVLWPKAFTAPAQQRAAYIRAIALIIVFGAWGLAYFLRQLTQMVCTTQPLLRVVTFFMLTLAAACAILAMIVQKRSGIDQVLIKKAKQRSKRTVVLTWILIFAVLVLGFAAMKYFLSRPFVQLERVHMVSATEGWAIGDVNLRGAIYHYQDGIWKQVPIPTVPGLTDISMVSPSEGWAVSNGKTMLHYKDGTWSSVRTFIDGLYGIDMISVDDGWAVGDSGSILHYGGSKWGQVTSPTTRTLESISMVSATEGWAVGGGGDATSEANVILHYQDGQWQQVDTPLPGPLHRIHMLSATEGWAVGGATRSHATTSVIVHYDHGTWTQEASPVSIPLADVSMVSATEGWAVGGDTFWVPLDCPGATENVKLNVLLHYDHGIWTQVASPTDDALRGISMLSADTGLMVGWDSLFRYVQGQWQAVRREG